MGPQMSPSLLLHPLPGFFIVYDRLRNSHKDIEEISLLFFREFFIQGIRPCFLGLLELTGGESRGRVFSCGGLVDVGEVRPDAVLSLSFIFRLKSIFLVCGQEVL